MKIEYPELAQVTEFSALGNANDLRFVWYYANRTSHLFTAKNGESNKTRACIKAAFRGDRLPDDVYKRYLEGNFPQKIKDAIAVMNLYNPSARIRAKMAIESVFDNLVGSLELDETMRKSVEGDLDEKKKYVELSIKVAENLPKVVAQVEEGYGIKTSSFFGGDGKGPTVMDVLHSTNESP